MLRTLLLNKIRESGISERQAGREIGIAHTTVGRLLNGDQCDYPTMKKISVWLNVTISTLLDGDSGTSLASKIALLVEIEPALAKVLNEAMDKVLREEVKPEILQDLISYMSYRLNIGENKNTEK
jgi:transcriptional regulator with XRE-family HTH domain